MDQHEIYAANRAGDDATDGAGIRQLPASTTAVTNDEHRVIADDWLRRAIGGIRVMHLDDDERRRVARELF
ncbi:MULTISPECIES: hypothetical protein [Burkholderia]|uniref:hypothetical protein n=1 Tax=Burkholderia TaxID=32008 RepID=UPI00054ED291|nr:MULTISPECIES: hypothetical protein [Burkholderia]MBH9642465.1 hypothetical protein [Burkholderia vietnamiensis]MBR7999449.1 hypothetical protein [Burkholderia vietnamiensis]MDN8039423.1 hypothetical protein [Burkholderia vietnamiensis]HDR9047686.1 hypothetical protein [Burkholderia vietnamiensis]HDR9082418.1 hypothetical protein [Burkholderia vietnamiensis]